MQKKFHFLVLFEEMAPYFWECLRKLTSIYPVRVLLISKKINQIAPFEFKPINNVRWLFREQYEEEYLLREILDFDPDCIYVSGWLYGPYHEWLKKHRAPKIILGFDTQWNGSIRQILGCGYFSLFKKKYYTHAFVPNDRQVAFAQKLGFNKQSILTGIYCCDTDYFSTLYYEHIMNRAEWPKNILFLGRYVDEKGFIELQEAFIRFDKKNPEQEWNLLLCGKGPLSVIKHPKIIDLGFVQPKDLKDIIKKVSFFILPSKFEPYGVVLHEMSVAGIPIVASKYCGASDDFLEDGRNGFLLPTVTASDIVDAFEKILNLSPQNLKEMSVKSHELGMRNNLELWAFKIFNLIKS